MEKNPHINSGMSPQKYREALSKLGLPIIGIAPYLGITPRQSQRYAAGVAEVPHLVEKVLTALLAGKLTLEDLK